ncbi:unnamed protein product, partial [Tilletia caries]
MSQQRQVVCHCSKCGPEGRHVVRSTRKRHELDDLNPWNAAEPNPSTTSDELLFPDDDFGRLDTLESDWGAHDDENGWGGDVDSSMTATGVDNDEDPELVAAAAVDDSLVPTMSQLETDWMRTDNEGVTARPEGLWLFELLLVWLNATFGISEHICGLLLTFIEAVLAQTTRQGEWMPTFRAKPQASVRLRRIRQSLWQGSLSVAYALCPVSTCWTPHILDNNTPSKCTQCDGPLLLGTDTSGEDDEEADADVPAPSQ